MGSLKRMASKSSLSFDWNFNRPRDCYPLGGDWWAQIPSLVACTPQTVSHHSERRFPEAVPYLFMGLKGDRYRRQLLNNLIPVDISRGQWHRGECP